MKILAHVCAQGTALQILYSYRSPIIADGLQAKWHNKWPYPKLAIFMKDSCHAVDILSTGEMEGKIGDSELIVGEI